MLRIILLSFIFVSPVVHALPPDSPVYLPTFEITTTRLSAAEAAVDEAAVDAVTSYQLKDEFYSVAETITSFQTDSLRKAMDYYQSYWQQK